MNCIEQEGAVAAKAERGKYIPPSLAFADKETHAQQVTRTPTPHFEYPPPPRSSPPHQIYSALSSQA
jgi:hypothetical protein